MGSHRSSVVPLGIKAAFPQCFAPEIPYAGAHGSRASNKVKTDVVVNKRSLFKTDFTLIPPNVSPFFMCNMKNFPTSQASIQCKETWQSKSHKKSHLPTVLMHGAFYDGLKVLPRSNSQNIPQMASLT